MTSSRWARLVVAALAFAPLVAAPRVSLALPSEASTDSAETHFRHGVTLYKDGDYEGALVEFRRAQDLSPNYRVLYNVGQSLYQLQRYADALTAFERYLAEGGTKLTPARRTAVEADVQALRARVGEVEIGVNEDGAEVRVDDQVMGTSPLAASVRVSVGHRRIVVSKAGKASIERFVDVAVGDHAKVDFAFPTSVAEVTPPAEAPAAVKEEITAPQPPTSPAAEPASSAQELTWLPWTATGVLAAGTALTGVLTLTSKQSLSNDLATYPGDPNAISQDRSRAKTFSVASDVFLAATAVSLGVALYVTLRSHHARTGAKDMWLRFGAGDVRLEGDF
jgi:hypothetical protein